jgi:hypothetical protein
MTRLAAVLAVAAALAGASEAAAPRQLLLTQDGVAGVKPGMTVVQVKHRLRATVAGDRYGNDLDVAVCGPKIRGEALFHIRAGVARLDRIAFAGGVRTTEGIAPGSTFRALRRAYGKRLVLDNDPDIHAADADVVHPTHRGGIDLVFTVDNESGRVVSIGLGFGGLLAVHCPTVTAPPPATIGALSLTGVASGIRPIMPENEVFAVWPWFPQLTDAAGSGWVSWMPVCAGATRGYAQFHSGDLTSVWFSSGASTDAGIAIGSTLDDLRAAYGTDLQGPEAGDYYVAAKGPPPVATLGFQLAGATVTAIGFGGRQEIGAPLVSQIWC